MKKTTPDTFTLDVFEGPLAFLLHLIQKSEINICDVPIHDITTQYLNRIKEMITPSVDTGAEFVGTTALLLWMKSKMLLPKHEQPLIEEEDLDPSFEMIHKLLEYCHFKETAKQLAKREEEQSGIYPRGIHSLPEAEKSLGIEHLTIEELTNIFQEILNQPRKEKSKVHEEKWRVGDKIQAIRESLKSEKKVSFGHFFSKEKPKGELIVTFLAILELMKIGEIFVGKDTASDQVFIFLQEES